MVDEREAEHVADEGLESRMELIWVARGRDCFDEEVVGDVVEGEHAGRELAGEVVRGLCRQLVVALLLVARELAEAEKAFLPALQARRRQLARQKDLRELVNRVLHILEDVGQRDRRLRPIDLRRRPHLLGWELFL